MRWAQRRSGSDISDETPGKRKRLDRRSVSRNLQKCAANVPQRLESREFFEAFEGTSGPSVRAVGGKRLIYLGWQDFLHCYKTCLSHRRSRFESRRFREYS